eukprot:5993298-Pleurochrysis_carterae.AAC.1
MEYAKDRTLFVFGAENLTRICEMKNFKVVPNNQENFRNGMLTPTSCAVRCDVEEVKEGEADVVHNPALCFRRLGKLSPASGRT